MRKEGVWGLYRGIASPIVAEAPKRAIKFTANEQYKQILMVCMYVCMYVCTYTYLSIYLSISVSISLSISVSIFRSTSLSKSTLQCTFADIHLLIQGPEHKKLSTYEAALAGSMAGALSRVFHMCTLSIAGVTETFANCPFETVKVRMQAVSNLSRYTSTTHCLTSILREEGRCARHLTAFAHQWQAS